MASAKVSKARLRNSSSKKDVTESDGKPTPNINNYELLSTVGKFHFPPHFMFMEMLGGSKIYVVFPEWH